MSDSASTGAVTETATRLSIAVGRQFMKALLEVVVDAMIDSRFIIVGWIASRARLDSPHAAAGMQPLIGASCK